MMDNLYVIVAAVVSFFVFSRLYGKLEWLSLSMMVLSTPAFFIMRERCDVNYCGFFDFKRSDYNFPGIASAFFGISVSAVASVLSERIFKNLSRGLATPDYQRHGRYYIHRVHLDFVTFVLLGGVWTWQFYWKHGTWGSRTDVMFGSWNRRHFLLLFLTVGQMWWAGLVVQHFSTVTKSLIQTIIGVLSACLVDPVVGITLGHNWGIRSVPSTLIAILIVICAILFQTGRLNVKFLWKSTGFSPKRQYGGLQACRQYLLEMCCSAAQEETFKNGLLRIRQCLLRLLKLAGQQGQAITTVWLCLKVFPAGTQLSHGGHRKELMCRAKDAACSVIPLCKGPVHCLQCVADRVSDAWLY